MTNITLTRLTNLRIDAVAKKQKLISAVEARGATSLTDAEDKRFDELRATIADLDLQIEDLKFDKLRAYSGDKLGHPGRANTARLWAEQTVQAIRETGGESRAISSGSLDVPSLLSPNVTAMPRPSRLIDLLVNRETLSSTAYEWFEQTVRTNEAAPVADLGAKPTSTLTITPKTDRARVLAVLSQPAPIRLWNDNPQVVSWLQSELVQGVYDALEYQVISGDGTGENFTGLLHTSGTTAVAYDTDLPTTLRSAITSLQVLGAINGVDGDGNVAWVLNPADAQALDLLRYSVSYSATTDETSELGFLTDGYTNTNARSANIFGDYPRVISNSIPAGTAILGDWDMLKLYIRQQMTLAIDAGGSLFTTNAFILRAELRAGIAPLMPSRFAIIDLTA